MAETIVNTVSTTTTTTTTTGMTTSSVITQAPDAPDFEAGVGRSAALDATPPPPPAPPVPTKLAPTPRPFPRPDTGLARVSHEVRGEPGGSRVFVGAPDYRVFIWGVEVSADVFSVSTTLTVNEQVSTALINIVNDNEKWIVPSGWATLDLDELSGLDFTDFAIPTTSSSSNNRGNTDILNFVQRKRRNMEKRLGKDIPLENKVKKKLLAQMKNSTIYPLLPGSSAFQMADPIRIFFRNPWSMGTPKHPATSGLSPADEVTLASQGITIVDGETGGEIPPQQILSAGKEDEEWYFGFTGYIASVGEDFDAQSNRSVLRIQCEDIRRLLRYMRTSTSPNIFDLNVYSESDTITWDPTHTIKKGTNTAVEASDLILITGSNSILSGMHIVKSNDQDQGLMELMLYGDVSQFDKTLNQKTTATPGTQHLVAGVLGFQASGQKIYRLPVDNNYESRLTSPTGPDGRSILDELYPVLSPKEVEGFGEDWSLGQDDRAPGKDVRGRIDCPNRLFVILPDQAYFPELKYPPDWGMRTDFFSEFRSRLDVINEFVQQADLWWYATPKGDIVVEFPSYDALPQIHQPPWRNILTLQNEFSRFSMVEDDHEIKTFTIFTGSATDAADVGKTLPFLNYAKVPNPELIARYGLREQRSNRPFFYDQKALPGALEAIATMLQEQANAEAYRLDGVEMLPSYRACPARPYLFRFRNVIGFCDQVSHQCVWGGLAQTVYHFKYIRHFDPAAADWTKISGGYGWSWKQSSKASVGGGGAAPITSEKAPQPGLAEVHAHLVARLQAAEKAGDYTTDQLDRLRDLTHDLVPTDPPPSSEKVFAAIANFNDILAAPGGHFSSGF